jgi:thiol-disulfide isomerase/thioredoxin
MSSIVNPIAPVAADTLRWRDRVGLALVAPRWALAVAGDRTNSGRASSDVIFVMLAAVLGAHLRGLIAGAWLGSAIDTGHALRAITVVLSAALTTTFAFLLVASVVLVAVAGPARSLSRAFDLACVALIPMLTVQMVVTASVTAFANEVPRWLSFAAAGIAYTWAGVIVANGVLVARQRLTVRAIPPATTLASARKAGLVFCGLAMAALASQTIWVATHIDRVRPMSIGDNAPSFDVSTVDGAGKLIGRWKLSEAAGKPVLIDFWATWCGPCREAMPTIATVTRAYAGRIEVIGINIDNPQLAAKFFAENQLPMRLAFDDAHVAEVFGVTSIPHLVLLDQTGHVRAVWRGGADESRMRQAIDSLLQ